MLFLAPTAGVLLSSIKTTRDIALGALWSIPSELYLGNFSEVLANPSVHRYFVNTLLVTAPATVASIALGAGRLRVRQAAVPGQQRCCFSSSSRGCSSRRR